MINMLIEFHNKVFFWLHSLAYGSEEFRFWLYVIAERIDVYVILVGIMFVLIHHHRRNGNHPELLSHSAIKEGLYIIFAVMVAWGIAGVLKIVFAVPRPFLQFSHIIPLFPYGGFDSFPSGHATLFAAMGTAIYMAHKKIGAIFLLMAIMIGLARVISGVHFPIDILAGWTLGSLSVIGVWQIIYYLRKKARS